MINVNGVLNLGAVNPANLSDAGTLLPTDQIVVWRNGVMLRTTVAALGGGVEPAPTLVLIPTGATEAVDGEYQRFAYDGVSTVDVENEGVTYQFPAWSAELPIANRLSEYQVLLKMPVLIGDQAVDLTIADAEFGAGIMLGKSSTNYAGIEMRGGGSSSVLILNNAGTPAESSNLSLSPAPTAGSVITLTLSSNSVAVTWDGGSGSIAVPVGFFASAPNPMAYSFAPPMSGSDVIPLSIKVAGV